VRMKLNESMRICRSWKDNIGDLTGRLWRNGIHPWKGKALIDSYLENLITRINEIFELRSQHDELLRLLSPEDQKRLNVDSTFDPFRKINAFYHNEYQSISWQQARKAYERNLEPMEKELCTRLRKEILGDKTNPSQLLREFQRWKGLMSRPTIKAELQGERESLLADLCDQVTQMKDEFESRTGQKFLDGGGNLPDKPPLANNMSEVVSSILWARQLSQKVDSNKKLCQSMLGDLRNIEKYNTLCEEFAVGIKEFENEQFKKWRDDIEGALNNKNEPLALQMSGRLMELDFDTGLLRVHYSEKLVTLLKDVRQLTELGFKLPKRVVDISEDGKKYYKEGVTLKQVANFYNNMSN
jgi:dynein heavy chain 2